MQLRAQWVLICFLIEVSREECLNLQKMIILDVFRSLSPFSQVFVQVKEWDILKQHKIIRVSHLLAYSMVFTVLSS